MTPWISFARRALLPPPRKLRREANEGVIAQAIAPGAKAGILVEINCETDFVARNEGFRAFCDEVARTLLANPKADLGSRAHRAGRQDR